MGTVAEGATEAKVVEAIKGASDEDAANPPRGSPGVVDVVVDRGEAFVDAFTSSADAIAADVDVDVDVDVELVEVEEARDVEDHRPRKKTITKNMIRMMSWSSKKQLHSSRCGCARTGTTKSASKRNVAHHDNEVNEVLLVVVEKGCAR